MYLTLFAFQQMLLRNTDVWSLGENLYSQPGSPQRPGKSMADVWQKASAFSVVYA